MSTTEQYQQRMKRIDEALTVKEPDRVPVIPFVQTYSVTHSGHTMAEAMYDSAGHAERTPPISEGLRTGCQLWLLPVFLRTRALL